MVSNSLNQHSIFIYTHSYSAVCTRRTKEIVMFAKTRPEQHRACGHRSPRLWLAIPGLLVLWLLLTTTPLFAANPPPVQIFYIPAPEDDGFSALKGIFPGPVPPNP